MLERARPDAPDWRDQTHPIALLKDWAYAGDETRRQTQRLGYQPVVASKKSNRRSLWQHDGLIYRRHKEIERLLQHLKGDRRVSTRSD